MRLPPGVGAAYQTLKWALLALVFGIFAANIMVPIGAIIFLIIFNEGLAFFLSALLWLIATGAMLWMASRGGRKERRKGEERPHAGIAQRRASLRDDQRSDFDILDIGLKPWRTGSRVFRDETLPDDIPSFFPTVKLWMRRSYAGKLFFEFYDEYGDIMPLYTRSKRVLLLTGLRSITPRPEVSMIGEPMPEGFWRMHVRLNDELLAVHEVSWFPVGEEEEIEADFVYPHAQAAVRLVGSAINDATPTLTDIGLLVVTSRSDEAEIFRTRTLPDNTVAVQPYVRLNLPERAVGQMRFVLEDANGDPQFTYDEEHEYDEGDNLIAARARLRVDDDLLIGRGWQLRVYVGEMLVAAHRFDWEDQQAPEILSPLEQDGEISARLRQRLEDKDDNVSLRDLLRDQRRSSKK